MRLVILANIGTLAYARFGFDYPPREGEIVEVDTAQAAALLQARLAVEAPPVEAAEPEAEPVTPDPTRKPSRKA